MQDPDVTTRGAAARTAVEARLAARAAPQCCGIDVPAGWVGILDRLDASLAALYPDYRLAQVKEKFGALRFYVETFGEPVPDWPPELPARWVADSLIRAAESDSACTCLSCGRPGRVRSDRGWLAASCAACFDEHDADTPDADTPDAAVDRFLIDRGISAAWLLLKEAHRRADYAREWLRTYGQRPDARADVVDRCERELATAVDVLARFDE